LTENQSTCFISDKRTCETSNSNNIVFIIGSGSPEFKADIDKIVETVSQSGFQGYFALLSEKEKGLDAFCDKICSKIKESLFCIAMLNDPIISTSAEGNEYTPISVRIPSSNVYYEFGMAVALGKNVIPVIRKGFDLPFDVQHLDTIYYENLSDLKDKLQKSIRSTEKKGRQRITSNNAELLSHIYGPLYNEIDRFVSKNDRFTSFPVSEYNLILNNYKYLFDTLEIELQRKITEFYKDLQKFNIDIAASQKVMRDIIAEQVSAFSQYTPTDPPLSISVTLETEINTILPTLDQILIRKITPELYLQATGSSEQVRKVTFKLITKGYKEIELDSNEARLFFQDCTEKVERNLRIARMRDLQQNLEDKGKLLKEEIKRLF